MNDVKTIIFKIKHSYFKQKCNHTYRNNFTVYLNYMGQHYLVTTNGGHSIIGRSINKRMYTANERIENFITKSVVCLKLPNNY